MRAMLSTSWLWCCIVTAGLSVTAARVMGQGLTITVDDPRPLSAVILDLEARFGWVVTYEDPRYLYPGDSRDVTAAVRRTHTPGQAKILVPKGGLFTFGEPAGSVAPAEQEAQVLKSLLEQYATTTYPGAFVLRHTGSVFHIVPTSTRNASGESVPFKPVLDMMISQEAGKRTALDAIEALVAQTKGTLVVGRVPRPLLMHTQVDQAAGTDSVRNLLLPILADTGMPLSWQVLCDPGDGAPCVLNIHAVRPTAR